ncbi:MAG: hypothetical protein GX605_09645, partial [Chloroflexi bacterium]|nr:hypothetical protein [Chloroflexota bacterium]
PSCGFDPAEAACAQHVTALGSPRGINDAVLADLRAKGCRVERVVGADAAETKELLDAMAYRGQRFLRED